MRKLHFNPNAFKAMFVQNGAHRMAETVPSSAAMITEHLDHFVDAGFTHWLTCIVSTWEQQRIASCEYFQFFQDL